METVWDHNPTNAELVAIFGDLELAEEARERVPSADGAHSDLAMLFEQRRDATRRDAHVAAIANEDERASLALLFAERA